MMDDLTERELTLLRVGILIGENPSGISTEALCREFVRRGWAPQELTPAMCGLAAEEVFRVRRQLDA
jgi:hypothetical protein